MITITPYKNPINSGALAPGGEDAFAVRHLPVAPIRRPGQRPRVARTAPAGDRRHPRSNPRASAGCTLWSTAGRAGWSWSL